MNFLHFLAGLRTPAGDFFFQAVTYLAQELFVVTVICWLYWCSNKKLAYTLGFSYFISGLLIQGLKITFRIPRPWILDPKFQPVASAILDATGYSFPSGHTQSITALLGTLAVRLRKTAGKIVCLIVILAVMFSRMYLGCHTPKDVLVSFFLTILCVLLTNHFLYKKNSFEGKEGPVSVVLFLLCGALMIYALFLNHQGIIETHYASDCLKAAGAGTAFSIGYYAENRYIRFTLPKTTKAKAARLIFGLLVAALLLEGLKLIIGTSLAAAFFRYFAAVLWIILLYPLLFSRKGHAKTPAA